MAFATRLRETPRFVKFLACGGIAAAVNWSSRFCWSLFLPFSGAVIAAYATGMVVAFILFRRFVFEGGAGRMQQQIWNFINVNLIGLAATWIVANLLVFWLLPMLGLKEHVEPIGHGLAIAAPVATSWFGHRLLTFR